MGTVLGVNLGLSQRAKVTATNDTVCFVGKYGPDWGEYNTRLWKTDGTAAGTVPVIGGPGLPEYLDVEDMIARGNDLFIYSGSGPAFTQRE